jgi:hypothetical protein
MFLAQEKALYQSLNTMKAQTGSFLGYFWCPVEHEVEINNRLAQQTATKVTRIQGNFGIEPPTYNKTTEFTWVFQ